MTYGECTVRGESERSVLIYCHTCHPSLANDNLSGIAVATHLAQRLLHRPHFYTYRFVFAPATIGAITWLSINEDSIVPLVDHGIVLSLLGNDANFTYKQSRRGNAIIDQVATAAVKGRQGSIRPFSPFGYDERQFCSPGFNLPVGCLTRTPYAEFSEYHTSDDNLKFVKPDRLLESLNLCEQIFADLENNRDVNPTNSEVQRHSAKGRFPINKLPKCEPVLGKYNLYSGFGQSSDISLQNAILWVLNLSDGSHSIEQMVDRSKMTEAQIQNALNILCDVDIVSVS
jgi:aminopeptidase-like protein